MNNEYFHHRNMGTVSLSLSLCLIHMDNTTIIKNKKKRSHTYIHVDIYTHSLEFGANNVFFKSLRIYYRLVIQSDE